MANKDNKPSEVKDAELHGGETYELQPSAEGRCPDCNGQGIRNPQDRLVCATCEGSGKA